MYKLEGDTLRREIVKSDDGSHTIKVPELKEHYHSHKGALQESLYVFIRMGLKVVIDRPSLSILEVGFGTGLNALVTVLEDYEGTISYTALEPYPVDSGLIDRLNYPEMISNELAKDNFDGLHKAQWEDWQEVSPNFKIFKTQTKLQELQLGIKYDLVYYDAFAPHAQPELWEKKIWEMLFKRMNDGGVLVTYCAKGQVRRDMQSAGFAIERLPGPPGKREMIRAIKSSTI